MTELSIILPVYKVEDYIEKCIRSLQEQDIDKSRYEIIVINDGSPDNSGYIVERLMGEFDNIKLINQENQGVSVARNAGINAAKGKYILFIDPDDYLDDNCLRKLLTYAEQIEGCELLMFNLKEVKLTGEVTFVNDSVPTNLHIDGITLYHQYRRARGETGVDASYGILMLRQFVVENEMYYIRGVPYLEDGEFIARVFCLATKCGFINKPFYNRTIRPGSATHSNLFFSEKTLNGFMTAAENLKVFRESKSLSKAQKEFLNQPICKFVLLVLLPSCSILKLSRFNHWVAKLKTAGLSRCYLQGCNNYYKIEGGFYNISPYLFFLHRLIRAPLLKIVRPY